MRIAHVNTEAYRGGAARMALSLVEALHAQGQDVCLYHGSDNLRESSKRGLKRFGSRYINALAARLGGSMTVFDMGFADELLNLTADCDILHIHNLHGYYINYRKLLLGWKDRPIVWTWHDQWGSVGRCGIPNSECDRWENGCGHCPLKEVYPRAWLDWSAEEYRFKSAIYHELKKLLIVTPSTWLKERAIIRGFSPDRVRIIPNPVNAQAFKLQNKQQVRHKLGLPENQPLLLFVSADCNDPRKGYKDFAKLVQETGISGVVVGVPPELRLPSITYTDVIKNQMHMNDYYSACDLLINTTYADNFPNVNVEAMAAGMGVLAYNVGGIPDQLPEFWDGLVPLGDVAVLIQSCLKHISNPHELSTLSIKFREHAVSKFDSSLIAKKYIEAYRDVSKFQPFPAVYPSL